MQSATELLRMAAANRAARQYVCARASAPLPPAPAKTPPPPQSAQATPEQTPSEPPAPKGRLAMMRTPPGMPRRASPLNEVLRKHDLAARGHITRGGHT